LKEERVPAEEEWNKLSLRRAMSLTGHSDKIKISDWLIFSGRPVSSDPTRQGDGWDVMRLAFIHWNGIWELFVSLPATANFGAYNRQRGLSPSQFSWVFVP
jgi:hypothetical protein